MKRIEIGSIITRNDGCKYAIVYREDMGKIALPSGITPILAETKAAANLYHKKVGDPFYYGDYFICGIEPTQYAEFIAAKQERVQLEREAIEQRNAKRRQLQDLIEKTLTSASQCMQEFNFLAAEEYFLQLSQLDCDQRLWRSQYDDTRAKAIQKWFSCKVTYEGKPFAIDFEQAQAVADQHFNTIVAARAGSGKTRTIVAKIVFLIAKYQIKPEEILTFVFNRKAANEINGRLQCISIEGKAIIINSEIATTFHAFARKIVFNLYAEQQKYGEILVEDRAHFIQAITKELPKHKLYKFFRSEIFQIKRDKFASEQEYYDAIRNSKYTTLDGHIVKSEAEKIICDFLFEHGIKYYYENEFYLGAAYKICKPEYRKELWRLKTQFHQDSIKPDFYLVDYCLPWEHWAISGNENFAEQSRIDHCGVIGEYEEYRAKMKWKRWFYARQWLDQSAPIANKYSQQIKKLQGFIETRKPAHTSRAEFENYLKDVLAKQGIPCQKLPENELIDKVWDSQVKRFSKMATQFIDRAEQQFSGRIKHLETIIAGNHSDERTQAFLELGLQCYKNYLAYLSDELPKQNLLTKLFRNNKEEILDFQRYGIDFNLLVKRAIELLSSSDKSHNLQSFLGRTEYILIDEYQDFSQLFLQMLRALRQHCPRAKLFVVGDDWQAINRFAGSDVMYFEDFSNYFPDDYQRLEITTNYRCSQNIIKNASTFIHNALHETGNFSANSAEPGIVAVLDPCDVSIKYSTDGNTNDDIFRQNMKIAEEQNPPIMSVKYLKLVTQIIAKNVENDKILILHRNNDTSFWYIDLNSFYLRLKRTITTFKILTAEEFDQKVEIMTMHRAKGLEADTVIILEADDGIIPSYHQDTRLFEIFGETTTVALNDQKRLFYVALTRAKHRLYILHRQQKNTTRDGFIRDLDGGAIKTPITGASN